MNIFTAVKYCCILHGHVCIMCHVAEEQIRRVFDDNYMSLVVRKPVFGVSGQVRHKPGCTATEDG